MTPPATTSPPPTLDPAGRISRQDDIIVEAAWCYYHDGLNQMEIAKRLGVSRASVVNYLAEARRRDYVRITLDSDVFRRHHLVHEVEEMFGLTKVLIVPSDPAADHLTYERVARAASDWLPQLLEPGDYLGVAWGDTVYRLAELAPKLSLRELTIVQLVGSKTTEIGTASENCAATLAARFGAKCVNLHVPLMLSSPGLAENLRNEPSIADQLRIVANCRKVVFACGTFGPGSHIERAGLLDRKTADAMQAKGATGVICGRVIDQDGRPILSPLEDQMVGVTLDQMRQKDMRVLVSASDDRLAPTLAALRGGYATHLVTSSHLAENLMKIGR